jgi:mono/diheme cytochrome c family protein
MNGPVLIPPAYGLKDSQHTTYTGDGDISYWNNYVAVTQMGGQGTFVDDRIGVNKTLPAGTEDLVKPKLAALRAYQFSLPIPAAPAVDQTMASRGQNVFAQRCASCHQGAGMTQSELHDPAEVGQDPTYAMRSASKKYRTTPLRALSSHAPYFHDGSAPDLMSVVNHYDETLNMGMVDQEKVDLAEYLKSF